MEAVLEGMMKRFAIDRARGRAPDGKRAIDAARPRTTFAMQRPRGHAANAMRTSEAARAMTRFAMQRPRGRSVTGTPAMELRAR
jgi:hypothetical protein